MNLASGKDMIWKSLCLFVDLPSYADRQLGLETYAVDLGNIQACGNGVGSASCWTHAAQILSDEHEHKFEHHTNIARQIIANLAANKE